MENRNRPRLKTACSNFQVVVTDDGSRTLYSVDDNETFHSESGALAESRLVFLENSGVPSLIKQSSAPVQVLEIGYGTGLNFLLTADAAIKTASGLEYTAIDSRKIESQVIEQLEFNHLIESEELYVTWLEWNHKELDDGNFQFKKIDLQLIVGDATDVDWKENHLFDAIYLDAFSPETTPELWTADFFLNLSSALKPGCRLVTYCVKSEIQRRLTVSGFNVHKTAGPRSGKREVLIATKE